MKPPCSNCGKNHRILTDDECRDRSMTEKTLQDRVWDRAKRRGWKVAHVGRAQVGDGIWKSSMSEGWPDLFMLRPPRALAIELKRELEQPDDAQIEWLQMMNLCGIPAVVIRPSDLRLGNVNAILD